MRWQHRGQLGLPTIPPKRPCCCACGSTVGPTTCCPDRGYSAHHARLRGAQTAVGLSVGFGTTEGTGCNHVGASAVAGPTLVGGAWPVPVKVLMGILLTTLGCPVPSKAVGLNVGLGTTEGTVTMGRESVDCCVMTLVVVYVAPCGPPG